MKKSTCAFLLVALILTGCNSDKGAEPAEIPCRITHKTATIGALVCPSTPKPMCYGTCEWEFEFENGQSKKFVEDYIDSTGLGIPQCRFSKYDGPGVGNIWPSCDTLKSNAP